MSLSVPSLTRDHCQRNLLDSPASPSSLTSLSAAPSDRSKVFCCGSMSDEIDDKSAFNEQSFSVAHMDDLVERLYGNKDVNLGRSIITEEDRKVAHKHQSLLTFGEILPSGVTKMMDDDHLQGSKAKSLYDLGMGLGKICIQVFFQFPNLSKVVGVELSPNRAGVAMKAIKALAKSPPSPYRLSLEFPTSSSIRIHTPSYSATTHSNSASRTMEFREGSLFDCSDAFTADIVIIETAIDLSMYSLFIDFLSHMKINCRLLTFRDLDEVYNQCGKKDEMPWERLAINSSTDRFEASWCSAFRFHLWVKVR